MLPIDLEGKTRNEHRAHHAALHRALNESGNAKHYGAVGDSATDNTTALQAAIDANAYLFLPPGDYVINGSLHITKSFTLAGAGCRATRLIYRGADRAIIAGSETADVVHNITIRDIGIVGQVGAAGGLCLSGVMYFVLEHVRAYNVPDGYGIGLVNYAWCGSIVDCWANVCRVGLMADAVNGTNAFNSVRVAGGEYGQSCEYGVIIGNPLVDTTPHGWHTGHQSVLTAVSIENCSKVGLWIVDGEAIRVSGCYFEGNEEAHIRIGRADHLPVPRVATITANRIGPVCPIGVDVQEASGVIVRENVICHRSAVGVGVGVRLSSRVTSPLLGENFFEDIQTPYDLPEGVPMPVVY